MPLKDGITSMLAVKLVRMFSLVILSTNLNSSVAFGSGISSPADGASHIVGYWSAYSKTALSITGNVRLSAKNIIFGNGQGLSLSYLGTAWGLDPASWNKSTYLVFRIVNPKDVLLLNSNTLCGEHPTYIAASVEMATSYELMMWGKKPDSRIQELELAVYSSDKPPSSGNVIEGQCATYGYVRELTAE